MALSIKNPTFQKSDDEDEDLTTTTTTTTAATPTTTQPALPPLVPCSALGRGGGGGGTNDTSVEEQEHRTEEEQSMWSALNPFRLISNAAKKGYRKIRYSSFGRRMRNTTFGETLSRGKKNDRHCCKFIT